MTTADAKRERLLSLDALRGFDMLWIVGGAAVLRSWAETTGSPVLGALERQTHHPEWNGYTAWDQIFPLFLFLAGVSFSFSYTRRVAAGIGPGRLSWHVVRRGLSLVFLGLLYNGLLAFRWDDLRCASVLGRIGLGWAGAALIALRCETTRGRLLWTGGILIGYQAALVLVPVPDFGAGDLTPGHTLTDWIDRHFLPGRLYHGDRDPEGLLATLPAVATALTGILAGDWLRREDRSGAARARGLAVAGAGCLVAGGLWSLAYPLNKNLWSSSFTLWTSGWSLILLALFYQVIDVWRVRGWTLPLVVIGSNAITVYLMQRFIDFDGLANILVAGREALLHPVLVVALALLLKWLVLYGLYRKRLFL